MSGCWGVGSQGDPRLIESMAVTYCYMLCVVCGVWCVYTMQTRNCLKLVCCGKCVGTPAKEMMMSIVLV